MVECDHSLIADVAVLSGGKVLLVKCNDVDKYDGEVGWFLPDDEINRLVLRAGFEPAISDCLRVNTRKAAMLSVRFSSPGNRATPPERRCKASALDFKFFRVSGPL